jgi:hypothetical protein
MQSEFLKLSEVARILRRPPATLCKWRRSGIGPPWIRIDGTIYYMRTELANWLARQFAGGDKSPIELTGEFRGWLMERIIYGPPPISEARVAELLAEMDEHNRARAASASAPKEPVS